MINFILGGSGTGKTTHIYNELHKLANSGNKKLMLLVPDQSSFETETAVLDLLGAKLSREVLACGFTRLCEFVFTKTGNLGDNFVDEGVRNIILSKALVQLQDNLKLYTCDNKKKSTVKLMSECLKECKKDNITPEMLKEASNFVTNDLLKEKLGEISLILSTYDSLISNTYIDPLDNLTKLANVLKDNPIFEDYTIFVDSFSGFSSQQLDVIRILMNQSKDFYISLNLDYSQKHLDFYYTTYQSYKRIKRIAEKDGIEIGEKKILNTYYRSENEDLKFLQRNIFTFTDEEYEKETENIQKYSAIDPYDEVRYVANQIKTLVAENNYRYKDIAVIFRNTERYKGIIDTVFDKYNISYFMDTPQDILISPVIRFVVNAIECLQKGFDRECILSMLKTGLVPFSYEEISKFENYLFIWQLDRKNLKNEFKDNPNGFQPFNNDDIEELAEIEKIRKNTIQPLEKFQNSTRNATTLQISKALYELLQDFKIEEAINNLSRDFEAEGLPHKADELVRTYNMLISALDKLVAVAGSEIISLDTYKEYLDFLIENMEISHIPQYQDQVDVASLDRVKLQSVKAVFVIGLIDGEFPAIPVRKGVFSENERQTLVDNNLPFTDSLEELACYEKHLAYCGLTSPCEKLFLSYHSSDYVGSTYKESNIFDDIHRLFPYIKDIKPADVNEFNTLWSDRLAFECLAKNYRENYGEVTALKNYFKNKAVYSNFIESIEMHLDNKPIKIKNKENAELIFRKNMYISASRIEKFSLCPFQYFCGYGLKAQERKVASIDSMEFGNVVHYFLEEFLKTHNKKALNLISDEDLVKSIDNILFTYAQDNFGGLSNKSNSFINLYNRLKKNIFTLVKMIIRQLEYSDFIPTDFELKIGDDGNIPYYTLKIDDEHTVSINGFIDRVDVMEKNDKELYVRIIDYKTGNKTFTLSEILYGINIQMLLYLRALIKNGEKYYGKKLLSAGILYMPSTTKEISTDISASEEFINKELDKNFKMNGLILDEDDIINSMDRNGNFIKKGKYHLSNFASSQQFCSIFNYIDNIIINMGKELLSGNIQAQPAKGEINGCEYCPYDSVCCHNSNGEYKFTEKLKPEQVYEKIGEEE